MIVIGTLDMIVGLSLAGFSTQLTKISDRIEFCAAVFLVTGCVLVGAALQLVC